MRLLETSVMIYMKMKFWESLVSRVQESLFHLWQSWVCYPLTFLRYQKVALFQGNNVAN
jgi:hypothetical protein